jgi:hypothetical protein
MVIDNDLRNLIIECLTEMRSNYGRTVKQSWDDVPMEDWEHNATIILEAFKFPNKDLKKINPVIQPDELNIKRMVGYDG